MLALSSYLLGVVELALLVGFSVLGAARLRAAALPELGGPPGWLATAVLALALLVLIAELLGSFAAFKALPFLIAVIVAGLALHLGFNGSAARGRRAFDALEPSPGAPGGPEQTRPPPSPSPLLSVAGMLVAALALIHFGAGVRLRLATGMTGFDSTWYHGPLAASFFQSGDTFQLHYLAPQYMAWFYPANAELFHAIGMAAFHRDILSPLLNLGWLLGCLFAAWCIGRPFGVAPISLALAAVALSVPALADQAGEARNDIAGTFFLLSAVAIALNAWGSRFNRRLSPAAIAIIGLAAGMAAGTKLSFLPAALVFVVGLALISPPGRRLSSLLVAAAGALVGGGYWYLRNLVQAGNPLPWVRHLGPISLPGPRQPLGGRPGHSVLGYLGDRAVWLHWFLPGLAHGFWVFWPLLGGAAAAGLLLSLGRRGGPVLALCALAGIFVVLTWILAPTSAEGPLGAPRGFESALRYLTPAVILGVALLPATPPLGARIRRLGRLGPSRRSWPSARSAPLAVALGLVLLLAIALGYREQRSYLRQRYADPTFASHGLDAVFAWARSISGASIATTTTREYPLFGTDLSNRVQFLGIERAAGGFTAPNSCRAWRRALDDGHYEYVVTALDRVRPGGPRLPAATGWSSAANSSVVLREPTAIVFHLHGPLAPAGCRG